MQVAKKLLVSMGWSVTALLLFGAPQWAAAQSFRVQCPDKTDLHPPVASAGGPLPNPGIKCQHIGGGDGFATMGDGHQIYLFGFAPLSGLGVPGDGLDTGILSGLPGTQPSLVFNDPASTRRARVEPADIMNNGVLYSNAPAPMIAIDEDDELFLTLSNVGQIMRPDLFEQHTVHFHGYPNASSFFDGVPDASVAINIAGSFTYYYTAPDPGTYFWHCHIAPPEHLQMGMVGQLFVRPRQNKVAPGASLYTALKNANDANGTKVGNAVPSTTGSCSDILCTGETPLPAAIITATRAPAGSNYAYNDGDGTTRYDVEYPIQIMGFDPNFHFVGMTFNPEAFANMKDKYFLLNGRSYPDTVAPGTMVTQSTDGTLHASQPLPSVINIPVNGRALLRISDLDVTEYQTLASLGIPMRVVGLNARLLRDMAGNDMTYLTNSITLAGGESLDVILDATGYTAGQKFYLYTPNLDHLSNDAENFGGLMTEVNICNTVNPTTKACL